MTIEVTYWMDVKTLPVPFTVIAKAGL